MMTVSYFPISTVLELETLDEGEIVEGYQDGLKGEPKPNGNRSKSYFHGWRNGMMDGGYIPLDKFSINLAHEFVAKLKEQK